jgi:hypothetical protein
MNKITSKDIEEIVGFPISHDCKLKIENYDLNFEYLNQDQRDKTILGIINHINLNLEKAGQHRLEKWENGWYENLELLKKGNNANDLVPKYFGKYDIARWKQDFVKGNSKYFDYYQLIVLVDAILHEYVGDKYDNLFEFGCGPAYHLLRFGNFNKNINLIGLDWASASQNIIQEINSLGINTKIKGYKFDFFNPDYSIDIPKNSAVFTCNALEQIGENYKEFINYLLIKKPSICINFEPMIEFLDEDNLVDQLCMLYTKKRNYLKGYLSYLEQLEKEGKIEIILKKRLQIGSLYIEGNPVVIWKIKEN